MGRTQSKCFLVSAIVHSLLLALLVVSSAFVTKKERVEDKPLLHMFDISKLTDDIVPTPGGGGPVAPPITPQPITPQPIAPPIETKPPEVKPVEVKHVEVKPPPIEPPKPVEQKPKQQHHESEPSKPKKAPVNKDPEALRPPPPKVKTTSDKTVEKPKIQVDLNVVKPNTDDIRKTKEKAVKEARDREERIRAKEAAEQAERDRIRAIADANAKAQQIARANAKELQSTLKSMQGGMSSGTQIEMPGPGAGAFANYSQVIWSIYNEAWQTPEARNGSANTRAEIIVARDGSIISARILDPSGDAAMDKSIRQVLDRVRSLPAFPEGSKDERRTFRLTFSLKAKHQLG